ncbi:alkaline phosphatase D family protein [Enhygromyxa salina]|uniref:Phospholipase D n=1 Tax=Enhygromyxa salina TaxID=215803 RepID=A0A2S9XN56_9BACT|nr:alkaline phosphatase D family protein [Enhygromyxa salina]PRP94304.1 Phospholipase D precursor [Enhygromyxa salina]
MSITRRELLRRAGLLGVASLIPTFSACAADDVGGEAADDTGTGGTDGTGGPADDLPIYAWEGDPGPASVFTHGVASGDPLADSVILWTRISPDDPSAEVFFEAALDPEFGQRVAAGYLGTSDETRDHTIKLDLDGLDPATTYYYRFWVQGVVSPIGRTRTAPDGASDHLRFVVCSCSSLAHGYFHGYRHIGTRADIDAVIHLGDYIYEYASGAYGDIREYEPAHECLALADYRMRHAQYKRDADLQAAHRQHPFITTWDDHEVANDGFTDGAENHTADEGDWSTRKAAGKQAYFEWMPVREGEPGRIYRQLSYGDLVDLIVLDTRLEGREEQVTLSESDSLEQINDPERQLLGAEQEAWLLERLSTSTSQWKLLAQQILMGQIILQAGSGGEPNRPFITDPWDGYEAARRTVYAHIADNDIADVVVLTGDIHTSWANELTANPADPAVYDPDTGEGAVSVEFVTPGITSPGLPVDMATINLLLASNPHVKWVELEHRGYMTIDVNVDRIHCDWWHIEQDQIVLPDPVTPVHAQAYVVETLVSRLILGSEPAAEKADPPPLAP